VPPVLAIGGPVLQLLRFFPGIEKTVYLLRQRAIKGAQGIKWHIDKAMFATSFHQVGHAAIKVGIHYDK
jgi:hypothetical protein